MAEQKKEDEDTSFQNILKDTLNEVNNGIKVDKQDEERVNLISKEAQQNMMLNEQQNNTKIEQIIQHQEQIIDPIVELVKNKNVLPLLAILDQVDLNMNVDGKPLLSRLCTMNIPLKYHLKNRQIVFKNDQDNRTALHQAILADDILSANWCIENKIGNIRDNFGNTPILQAIKLGRKNAFLLLLHFQYYDSEAPHVCATYNRLWQLKVLSTLGYEIVSVRDSEHFNPIQRAVANYSYDVAQYLAQISDNVSPGYLANKTESKGIIRIINKVINRKSIISSTITPFLQLFIHFIIIYLGIGYFKVYQPYVQLFYQALIALGVAYVFLFLLGMNKQSKNQRIDLMRLLKAPQFPVLQEICPQTLQFKDPNKQYCRKCKVSKQKFHFHLLTCVSKNNQIFWLIIEILWFIIVYNLHEILFNLLKFENLIVLNFSDSLFFRNSIIVELLFNSNKLLLLWFIYLKIFMIYQILCLFQWFSMLTLNRTYQQINNTHKYKRLYRIVQNKEGGYKSQEIKLLQEGFWIGMFKASINIIFYFFT